jgi:hypothetical protein
VALSFKLLLLLYCCSLTSIIDNRCVTEQKIISLSLSFFPLMISLIFYTAYSLPSFGIYMHDYLKNNNHLTAIIIAVAALFAVAVLITFSIAVASADAARFVFPIPIPKIPPGSSISTNTYNVTQSCTATSSSGNSTCTSTSTVSQRNSP